MREPETTVPSRHPSEETARLGKEIYERDIRPQVEADHRGEVVAIDVDSGSWAIGVEVLDAVDYLGAKHPGAVNVLSERVGHRALDSFGGRFLPGAE